MEKKKFIKPSVTIVKVDMESIMLDVSKTEVGSSTGSTTEGPEYGGDGDGSDAGSKLNSGSLWDD